MKITLDKCYCINLKERVDRWGKCLGEINKLKKHDEFKNLEIIKFEAIKSSDGKSGLGDSFKMIIRIAQVENKPYVLCLEDDFNILDSQKIVDALNNAPEDWDVLSGGAYFLQKSDKYNDHWYKINAFSSTHFLIINQRAYKHILNYDYNRPIDGYLSRLIKTDELKMYIIYPMPVRQFEGYSDIRKKNVNYNDRKLPWIGSKWV